MVRAPSTVRHATVTYVAEFGSVSYRRAKTAARWSVNVPTVSDSGLGPEAGVVCVARGRGNRGKSGTERAVPALAALLSHLNRAGLIGERLYVSGRSFPTVIGAG